MWPGHGVSWGASGRPWARHLHHTLPTVADLPLKLPDLCTVIPTCPLCGGRMELVYDRARVKVCVCTVCHTGISVPARAWAVAFQRGAVRPEP